MRNFAPIRDALGRPRSYHGRPPGCVHSTDSAFPSKTGVQPHRDTCTTRPSSAARRSARDVFPQFGFTPNLRAMSAAETGVPSNSVFKTLAASKNCLFCEGKTSSGPKETTRFCKAPLEELVDPGRSSEPGPMGGIVRRGFLQSAGVCLRCVGRSGPVAFRTTLRAPRQPLRFRGRAAAGLRGLCPTDLPELGHAGHAHRRVPPPGPAAGRVAGIGKCLISRMRCRTGFPTRPFPETA